MGKEDDVQASVGHVILCAVAGRGISALRNASFTDPGMHANFFIHGILGFFHYQSGILDNDLKAAYTISMKATRYLALPCLMADMYRNDHALSSIHLLSGLVPFALALAGEDNIPLGNLVIACNIISLAHYSHTHSREYGWYAAGAAVFAYMLAPQMHKICYPIGLALMEYFSYRLFHVHFDAAAGPPRR